MSDEVPARTFLYIIALLNVIIPVGILKVFRDMRCGRYNDEQLEIQLDKRGTAVVSGLPFYTILSLPILFPAAMYVFDTADGCFMNFGPSWAFAARARKAHYNLTIPWLSVVVAFFIGTTALPGLIGQKLQPRRRLVVVHGLTSTSTKPASSSSASSS